jgi:hypothetical protein
VLREQHASATRLLHDALDKLQAAELAAAAAQHSAAADRQHTLVRYDGVCVRT